MIILGHCCISGRSHHVCPLIYTLSMPTVIISHIMANSFLINPCNALSDSHGISDVCVWMANRQACMRMGVRGCAWVCVDGPACRWASAEAVNTVKEERRKTKLTYMFGWWLFTHAVVGGGR